MARVNHKLVKQRLNEKRSQITDRQFFSSRILAGHFEDLALAQTQRYHYNRRIRVNLYWKPKEPYLASTNNIYIRINTGNPMVTDVKGRENRYQVVCGVFAHELGHVLYTDFLAGQTHENYFASQRWYPCTPELRDSADTRRERAFWEYVKESPENLAAVRYIAHYVSNIIEDGYIENRMLNDFPGTLGLGLETMRELHFKSIPTVTQLIEQEEDENRHIFESIMQITLSYAKFGEIKYGDEPLGDVRIQTVFGLIHDIDHALLSKSGKDRLDTVNRILVRCWDYIEGFLELFKKQQEEKAELGGAVVSLEAAVAGALGTMAGSTEIGTGDSTPVGETDADAGGLATAGLRAKTQEEAEESKKEPEEDSHDSSQAEVENEENPSESGGAEPENKRGSAAKADKQKPEETETERIPYQQTESISEPLGGTVETNESYQRESYDRAAEDIERLLDKMAEKEACEQLENERLQELNEVAQSISYGDIHSGVHIRINRITSVDEELREQYDAVAPSLTGISRQLQKSIIKELKENRRGGKRTGLLMGHKLDAHALCRNDGKVFYRNNLPNETPELAVGLLLDESGSMSGSGRCTYARASAIILYDFCQGLEIPVMVYGHSTGHHSVELYSYAEFDGFDQDDKYRMMDISARSSNRDGAALRYVAERLSKRPEAVKMLILVSDGQPADGGYYGSAAEEDLRGIKQEYQRKGILFVSAAIGDDKQDIERIYGDSFLDISDLRQLPIKLTSIVKKHIKV